MSRVRLALTIGQEVHAAVTRRLQSDVDGLNEARVVLLDEAV